MHSSLLALNVPDVDYSRSAFILILFMHRKTYMNNFLIAHISLVIKLNLSIIYILANDIRIRQFFFQFSRYSDEAEITYERQKNYRSWSFNLTFIYIVDFQSINNPIVAFIYDQEPEKELKYFILPHFLQRIWHIVQLSPRQKRRIWILCFTIHTVV